MSWGQAGTFGQPDAQAQGERIQASSTQGQRAAVKVGAGAVGDS